MGRRRMKKSARIALLAFWVIVIFVLTGYPHLGVPKIQDIPIDKVYHFVLFFILGLLEYRLFKTGIYFAVGCSIAILAEVQQIFIPGRGFEILDILAGLTGLVISYILFYRRIFKKHAVSKT
jgi:VanZ family protein